MKYKYLMRFYQWEIAQRFRVRPLELFLVWYINRIRKRHYPKWLEMTKLKEAARRGRH